MIEKGHLFSAILSAIVSLISVLVGVIASFTKIQPLFEEKLQIIASAFLLLFFLIAVPVYILTKRPGHVKLLRDEVTRAFSEALDRSPFNPEAHRRS